MTAFLGEIESIIHINFAKQSQSVKKNAGQVSCIKIDVSSIYKEIMEKNRI
jgi:hypothetical protein